MAFPRSLTRTSTLSNRNCCYSDVEVDAITQKRDDELTWRDFDVVFALSGCTAQYEEQLGYLPAAFRYLRDHPSDGREFLADIVYFASKESGRLEKDEILGPTIEALWSCLRAWTQHFEVRYFDEAACRAKGWGIDHFDYVVNSEAVRDLFDVLLRYGTFANTAEEMVTSLVAPTRRDEDSAWLLEFAKEERNGYMYYSATFPGKERENTPTMFSSAIHGLIMDDDLLARELTRIGPTILKMTPSPTYWPDLVHSLGLTIPFSF